MLNIWNHFSVKFCFSSISDKVSDIKSERITYLVFCLANKIDIWCDLPLSPDFGHWWRLETPDGGFASWSLFGYGHWSLIHPYCEDWLSIFGKCCIPGLKMWLKSEKLWEVCTEDIRRKCVQEVRSCEKLIHKTLGENVSKKWEVVSS